MFLIVNYSDCLQCDVQRMISEKNQAVEDLQNVENAFADVHRKYERTKQVIQLLNLSLNWSYAYGLI